MLTTLDEIAEEIRAFDVVNIFSVRLVAIIKAKASLRAARKLNDDRKKMEMLFDTFFESDEEFQGRV